MKIYSGFDALPTGTASDVITPGCLVLEGAGFRGVYTSGVLDVLMENDISLQTVVGASSGALNGINYVSGQIGRSARINLGFRHDSRYVSAIKGLFNKGNMINLDFIFKEYEEYELFDIERFRNSKQHYIAVATSLEDGKVRYFEKGQCTELRDAIKASATMPVSSKAIEVDGEECFDGCITEAIPVKYALEAGYEKIVVVRTYPKGFRKNKTPDASMAKPFKDYPEFAQAIVDRYERYNETCDLLDKLEAEGKVIQICPTVADDVDKMESDMEKLGKLYYQGYKDTMSMLPDIEKYLGIQSRI